MKTETLSVIFENVFDKNYKLSYFELRDRLVGLGYTVPQVTKLLQNAVSKSVIMKKLATKDKGINWYVVYKIL